MTDGPAMADSQTRNQFVELLRRVQTQRSIITAAITAEIENSTEMRIGMVVTPDHLPPLAEHRPAALQMEIKAIGIESRHRQIAPDASRHLIRQVTEVRVLMQLPNAIEIAGPGAALIGIAGGVTPHRQERLQLSRQIQRVKNKAIRCNNGGE